MILRKHNTTPIVRRDLNMNENDFVKKGNERIFFSEKIKWYKMVRFILGTRSHDHIGWTELQSIKYLNVKGGIVQICMNLLHGIAVAVALNTLSHAFSLKLETFTHTTSEGMISTSTSPGSTQ